MIGLWIKLLLIVVVVIGGWFSFRPTTVGIAKAGATNRYGEPVRAGQPLITLRKRRLIAYVLTSAMLIILVGGLGGGVGICPNGNVGLVCAWGVPTGKVVEPGMFYVIPIAGSVRNMNIQVTARSRTIEAASSDQQDVTGVITVNYRTRRDSALALYREYRSEWRTETLDPAIEFWSKAATAQYTPQSLLHERSKVAEAILNGLKSAPQLAYFEIVAVNVENLTFSAAYTGAIEAKMVAEQKALEEENKLRQVEFQAAQTLAQAKADAEKIRIQADAIQAQGGMGYVTLQMIGKWNGQLPPTLIIGGDNASPFQILDVGQLVSK